MSYAYDRCFSSPPSSFTLSKGMRDNVDGISDKSEDQTA
jgi:hypothetical protein